jgi:putative DNA-invertase from lambdoid prophage Rac
MRAAIYLYVSKKEGFQAAELQLLQMKATASRDGWEIYRTYCDIGLASREKRAEYEKMISDAEHRRFDVLLFWSLENLSFKNTAQTLALLQQLSKWRICFCSYKEQHLNTCHFLKDAVLSLIATFAQQDRVYIGYQTVRGLEKQRQTQKPGPAGQLGPGRPPAKFDREKAKKLHAEGVRYEKIAKACGVSKATISRYFKSLPS